MFVGAVCPFHHLIPMKHEQPSKHLYDLFRMVALGHAFAKAPQAHRARRTTSDALGQTLILTQHVFFFSHAAFLSGNAL